MQDRNRGSRIVVRRGPVVLAAVALAVAAVAALLTILVGMALFNRGQATAALATATGDAVPTAAEPAASAVLGPTSAAPSGPTIHVVKQGETLIGIASQYGVPLDLIVAANHLKNTHIIVPGQQIIIPDTLILTPVMTLGTSQPSPTPTLPADDTASLSVLSGWPRSLTDGTQAELDANYPSVVDRGRFKLHYQPGTYPDRHTDEVADRVGRALSTVEARLGVHLGGTFDAYAAGTLFAGLDAHLRGQSRSRDRRLFFLSDGTGTPAENDYAVTHELTHLVVWNTWGTPSSTMLSEGVATYVGKPELEGGGFMPYDQLCLGIMAADQMPPLAVIDRDFNYFQGHIEDRFDYFGSACFVQYLVDTYGLQPMSQLYHSSDYVGLYGSTLSDLDQRWRASLAARQGQMTIDPAALVSYTQEVTSAYRYVFKNINDTLAMHQAYLAVDQARIALWKGDYPSTRHWLDQVYQLTGLTPQPGGH